MFRKKIEAYADEEDVDHILSKYAFFRMRKILIMLVFCVVLIVAFFFGLTQGSYPMSMGEAYSALFDHLSHLSEPLADINERIIWNQRLPRTFTAIIAGAGLAVAGTAMQSMMKNPLADPYTTGISSGASFGAVTAIVLGLSIGSTQNATVFMAFLFALVPAGVIVLVSRFKTATPGLIILVGISVMYIFNALTQYMMLVGSNETMAAAYEWTIGTLSKGSWDSLPVMLVITVAGSVVLLLLSNHLNAMNSGDDYAKTVGINVSRTRILVLVTISIVAAGIVSFTGIIGFVGLVAPHITRILLGSDNKFLLPASMLLGATMLVLCDIASKAFTNNVIPIGIVTSIIGGPVFLFLILRQRKEVWRWS